MRSTRASAAWAGMAMATSFLSVMIIGTQPHTTTATRAIAESVAITSTRDALSITKPLKRVGADKSSSTTAVASR